MNDNAVIQAILDGNEPAFETLVTDYYPSMQRLARVYGLDGDSIQDVIQETWIGVLQGLKNFRGEASLKTWVFSILINRARSYARREDRHANTIPLEETDSFHEFPISPERFRPADDPNYPHHWATHPKNWDEIPEDRLISQETHQLIEQAIQTLPTTQREVMILRDLQHLSAEEVCTLLNITDSNQRVLLHRARAKVRQALESYLQG